MTVRSHARRSRLAKLGAALFALFLAGGCIHDWSLDLADGSAPADASVVDVRVDASPSASDAGAFTCEGALLCDPFEGAPLAAVWDGVLSSPGGSARVEAAPGAPSPPNVLLAERAATKDSPSTAYVTKVLGGSLTRARMELDIAPQLLDPESSTTVAGIIFEDERATEHKIRLALRDGEALLQELGATGVLASHALPRPLATGAWAHVAFGVEVGGRITVAVDGATVVDVATNPTWRASTRTRLIAGINFVATPHVAIRVQIDNVRVDGS